ncbi:VWA domain-containing protein [Flavobacteriaceae bacterium TP-CH-4]|uniref:VWA domain-containing protein n=1 Tax=Pelagihabitans pacificus TaxID=2696054 RepID=A0A967ASI7_9FLAO|nr:VWA domain-containing protein [Pelagihabitans pacificus]NHF59483.1 VWA domain-containing protein [Pelagihabitans pacificus]
MKEAMQPNPIEIQTTLSGNIVLLCRFLRGKGFPVGASEESDALLALTHLPIGNERYFQKALKAVLTKNQYQQSLFDELYLEFWKQLSKAGDSKIKQVQEPKNQQSGRREKEARFESLKDWLNLNPTEEEKQVASFSDIEVLAKKDFVDLSKEEMQLMMRLLQKMARRMAHQKSRLKKYSKKHRQLDLRRTMRCNMRHGGELQHFVFSQQKEKKLKLVLLCDVSRSMDLYSRFFVHLIYAFQNAYDKIETFVFSTALHRVSELLDNNEFEKAFDMISDRVPQWSGGTTIGSCLYDFTNEYGYGMLDKKTLVLILSDGWDTGAPEVLKEAMQAIYKKSKKVFWLNPLAGSPDFSPDALGMKTALPYIDVLASAHNLESLKQVLYQFRQKRKLRNTSLV